MGLIIKQVAKYLLFVVILLALAGTAWARGAARVANTMHNLSSNSFTMYASDNVDEVCVFCHTPHGGSLKGPLWNRSLPDVASFTHYNSATISGYLSGLSVSRNINDESLLCLSCHDGSVALDHLINSPNSLNGAPVTFFGGLTDVEIMPMFGPPASRIGGSLTTPGGVGDLSDDHPISFSYQSVLADAMYQPGGSKDGELRAIGNVNDANTALGWKGEGVRFFGSDYRLECSSCHDPHVDYDEWLSPTADVAYIPFLIRPNSGSDLCLACHIK